MILEVLKSVTLNDYKRNAKHCKKVTKRCKKDTVHCKNFKKCFKKCKLSNAAQAL